MSHWIVSINYQVKITYTLIKVNFLLFSLKLVGRWSSRLC